MPRPGEGLSLFIVPKYLVNADGSRGERNDVQCLSIEKKLGIKASPTAVLQYGQNNGAIGYLLGEKQKGLDCMFLMMNSARVMLACKGWPFRTVPISMRLPIPATGFRERHYRRRVNRF